MFVVVVVAALAVDTKANDPRTGAANLHTTQETSPSCLHTIRTPIPHRWEWTWPESLHLLEMIVVAFQGCLGRCIWQLLSCFVVFCLSVFLQLPEADARGQELERE